MITMFKTKLNQIFRFPVQHLQKIDPFNIGGPIRDAGRLSLDTRDLNELRS